MVELTTLRAPVVAGNARIRGIIPVMLTPFLDDGAVDYEGLDRLTDWYLANGVDALFAVCQSSEMQYLTLDEKVAIARRVVARVRGRVPVMASGHTSDSPEEQLAELSALIETGIDTLVLVTNRLDMNEEGERPFAASLDRLLARLSADVPLGLYECPAPYRRLLSDAELQRVAASGRFVVLKDVSCDLPTVTRRVALTRNSPLSIVNANAAIAFDAMKAGSQGFCGVFTNFHPDLYGWLYRHAGRDPELAVELAAFLALSAMAEGMGYPVLAKLYHQRLGTFGSIRSRVITYDIVERYWALLPLLDTIAAATERFRERIAALR
jgi:4-hydroxy-tetrahydrodipicolinate synthase